MANMSYCRFRNTLKDYSDCVDALYESDGELSDEEARAAKELLIMSFNVLDELGLIENDSINHEELNILIERLKDGCQ